MCSVEGCEKPTHSKNLCQAHYRRLLRNGDPLASRRPGPPRREGSTDHRRRSPEEKAAQKVAREQARAQVKAAKVVCVIGHRLTPENTYVTDRGQKVCRICQRMAQQKRAGRTIDSVTPVGPTNGAKTQCKRGHEYTPENTYLTYKGFRVCKRCRRLAMVKNVYGLSEAMFFALLEAQQDACAVCQAPFEVRTPRVDHDHVTGAVRGLLCDRCNIAAGHVKDSPEIAQALADYLRGFTL